ncbi:hypothetical protein ABTL52_20120, partial [Acinetobacter baumannii]
AIVNREGFVKTASTPFESLLSNSDSISLHNNKLKFHDAQAHRILTVALQEAHAIAFREISTDGSQPLAFVMTHDRHQQLMVTVAPIS